MSDGKGLGKVWSMGKGAVKELVDQLGVNWDMMRDDFIALKGNGLEKIAELRPPRRLRSLWLIPSSSPWRFAVRFL